LSSVEEKIQDAVDKEAPLTRIAVSDLAMLLWRQRRKLAIVAGVGFVLATAISFLIPNEYQSTARLMPPDPQTFSRTSVLNSLTAGGIMLQGAGGGLLNARTVGSTAIGVLSSRTVQDDIIHRYDLRKEYRCKFDLDARKKLADRTTIVEDTKSGIITVTVTDREPQRARDILESYIEELNALVNSLSTSSARRERLFLEQRLKSIKEDLDADSGALSQFSSHNAAFDPKMQGEAAMQAVGRVQGELIAAQSELSGMRAEYTDDNERVRQVRGRVEELQRQLKKMAGAGESPDASNVDAGPMLPSVRELPVLGLTYNKLYRKVTMEETLYETLTKQYELAKVQEAEEIPQIKVLDAPDVPEHRSSSHRLAIILVGTWLSLLVGALWIIVSSYRRKSATLLS
jgi:capsule polysaccharide export protein KpsE/RkpR